MYKDILVHVDSSPSVNHRSAAAIAVATRFDAHVTGLYVMEPIQMPAYAEIAIGADLVEQSQRAWEQLAAEAGQAFDDTMKRAGIASEWRTTRGYPGASVIDHGHYSDLVVVGQADPGAPDDVSDGLADDVVMEAGRPVMVVPYIGARETIGRRILVAWNGSREAVRAIHDAMGFLKAADAVIVMSVNPPGDESRHIAGADISRHLARHGVKAQANSTVSRDVDVGDTLLSRAADEDVDLVVMGAYGHSRFRERVLGGATRDMLQHMTVPVLMSH